MVKHFYFCSFWTITIINIRMYDGFQCDALSSNLSKSSFVIKMGPHDRTSIFFIICLKITTVKITIIKQKCPYFDASGWILGWLRSKIVANMCARVHTHTRRGWMSNQINVFHSYSDTWKSYVRASVSWRMEKRPFCLRFLFSISKLRLLTLTNHTSAISLLLESVINFIIF